MNSELQESIQWWEKRRFFFNIILIIIEVGMMVLFSKTTLHFGIGNALILTIFYNIAANIFYSIGWGIDVLCDYYRIDFRIEKPFRIIWFLIGLLFSSFITIGVYLIELSHLNHLIN